MFSFIYVFIFFLALVSSQKKSNVCYTRVRGKAVCGQKVIFEDEFSVLNQSIWRHGVRFAGKPEHEFVLYGKSRNNTYVGDFQDPQSKEDPIQDALYIKPTLLQNEFPSIDLYNGEINLDDYPMPVGSSLCSKKGNYYQILPPISSGTVHTFDTFRFRYGVVEFSARMPSGDWIYPIIELRCYNRSYKDVGRIVLATTRGNKDLKMPNSTDPRLTFGQRYLEAGVIFNHYNPQKTKTMFAKLSLKGGWSNSMHIYRFEWEPESMKWYVDNELIGALTPPPNGFLGKKAKSKMAPFDDHFYLTIGVGVGGTDRFPDGIISSGHKKPWKNLSPKNMLQFWEDYKNWYPTWQDEKSALIIDYIKITSL